LLSECAQANGWVVVACDQTPGYARQAYLKHGFGTVAKQLVRAGHAEAEVKAAQEELIGNMTSWMVALVMQMAAEIRLARELPGLPPDGLPLLDDEWHETDNPQAPKKFCELAPEKISRRWRSLQHAYALVVDGVAGTNFTEKYFANADGAGAAARIADYCRQAFGRMKPGDEAVIIREAIRLARLDDFLSLQKLMINLEQVRQETEAAPDLTEQEIWLKHFADTQAELGRSAARVAPGRINGVRSHSADRHIILQGRDGQPGAAGFFTWDDQVAAELPQVGKALNGQCLRTKLITPADGVDYWGLVAEFKPFENYSQDDKVSVEVYLREQVALLEKHRGRNDGDPV